MRSAEVEFYFVYRSCEGFSFLGCATEYLDLRFRKSLLSLEDYILDL